MKLTGFGNECFKKSFKGGESNKALLKGYCSVLNSKQSEESQVSLNYHMYDATKIRNPGYNGFLLIEEPKVTDKY